MMDVQNHHRGFRWKRKRAEVRIHLGAPYGRRAFLLTPAITTDAAATERAGLFSDVVARLRSADRIALALPLLERLAAVEGARDVKAATAAIEAVLAGDVVALPKGETTFGELTQRWTSGELARLYPDHVRAKDTAAKDAQRFESYLRPHVGPVPLASFMLDHAQYAMRQLPPHLSPATRRQIAQLMHRVLALAVFPVRAIKVNPLPRGFLPRVGSQKAKTYLYPREDGALLGCAAVPLACRIFYGFLNREGMRAGEAEALEWSDVDLVQGVVTLAENKTDDPRAWALRPDVVRALRAWRALREARGDHGARVFVNDAGEPLYAASTHLRAHLHAAGVERAALFERSATRQPIRRHDLRATFITIALANGRTEAWIADRTGHRSSLMINRYRRQARSAAELGLGDLASLDLAIPELAPVAASPGSNGSAPAGTAPDAAGSSGPEGGPDRASGCEGSHEAPENVGFHDAAQRPDRLENPRVGGSIPSLGTEGNDAESFGFEAQASAALDAGRSEAGPKRAPSTGAAPPAGRMGVVVRLAGELGALVAAGDLEAAREVHETIGRLLAPARSEDGGRGGVVIDLEAERGRRGAR